MDELHTSFVNDSIIVWGISSHTDEVFTPVVRLEKICSEVFPSNKNIREKMSMEIPTQKSFPEVSPSMRHFYSQFSRDGNKTRIFTFDGIEIGADSLIENLQSQTEIKGVLFGDSFDFFRMCIAFSYRLVSRQRYVPFYKEDHSYFISNLEASDDHSIFRDLCEKAPFSIKGRISDGMESTVKKILNHFLNSIIINYAGEELQKFNDRQWKNILGKLAAKPILLGRLLNNEMPEDIEKSTGHSFIPKSFDAQCSCPDYANPCKHIAAVFYTLADEIDYDPMILFKLKGIGKEELFVKLGLTDEPQKMTSSAG